MGKKETFKVARLRKSMLKLEKRLYLLNAEISKSLKQETSVESFVEIIKVLYIFQGERLLEKCITKLKKCNYSQNLTKDLYSFNDLLNKLDKRHNLSKPGELISSSNTFFYCRGNKKENLVPVEDILSSQTLKTEIRNHPVNGIMSPSEWDVVEMLASMEIENILEWVGSLLEDVKDFKLAHFC